MRERENSNFNSNFPFHAIAELKALVVGRTVHLKTCTWQRLDAISDVREESDSNWLLTKC